MSDYIINANKIFIELKDNIENFKKEALIINEIKCYLINYRDLEEFSYPGVSIYDLGYKYEILYDDKSIEIEVEDGVIVGYKLN